MGKVVTREWRKAKSAKLEFAFVSAFRDNSSFGLNILGPLCLWQCLLINIAFGNASGFCLTLKISNSCSVYVFETWETANR